MLALLLELASLAVYYYQHGWLFYVAPYRTQYQPIAETQAGQLTASGLNPYFGPIHRPGIPFDVPEALRRSADTPRHQTNNFGFVSPYDYPVARKGANQFLIGLFGGSVGNWFCEVGATRLLETLQAAPAFRGRELVPVCLSHEGYKQPQQALVLAYFLSIGQQFDLVINIDGFNEVALGHLNDQRGWDVSMPSVMHLEPLINIVNQATLTPGKVATLAAIERDKHKLNWLAENINGAKPAAVYVIMEAYYRIVDRRYQAELLTFQQLPSNPPQASVIHVTPRTQANAAAAAATEWAAGSLLMHDMLAARGVPYFDVLQPNQYHTSRVMSAGQARVALSDDSPFKAGVEEGYPLLEKALVSARAAHPEVRMLDGTHIFDAVQDAVYIDNCCHYTLKGNDVLADFIARAILSAPASTASRPPSPRPDR